MAISRKKLGRGESDRFEIRKLQREEQVLKMRLAAVPFRIIAEALGMTVKTVHTDAKRAMKRLIVSTNGRAEENRTVELERLEELQMRVWPKAIGVPGFEGNQELGIPAIKEIPPDLDSIEIILKISASRAKLLGLNTSNENISLTGKDGGPIQLEGKLQDMTKDERHERMRELLGRIDRSQLESLLARTGLPLASLRLPPLKDPNELESEFEFMDGNSLPD